QITGIVDSQTASGSTFTNTATVAVASGVERDLLDNSGNTAVQVSNTDRCGLTTDTYNFNATAPITMQINTLGNVDCISVMPMMGNHPAADHGGLQANDRWWQIASRDSSGNPANGTFSITLTLPTNFNPTAQDKLCRYTGPTEPLWDCAYSSHTDESITRENVTEFSDWIAAQQVGPTAVTLFGVAVGSDTAVGGSFFLMVLLLVLLTAVVFWIRIRRRHLHNSTA
ncbi:MAG: hypothetical protein KDD89_10595, partial [Anaerolineales bacterium]|nr:hypothetical protein [Anaerolineales bacterium]